MTDQPQPADRSKGPAMEQPGLINDAVKVPPDAKPPGPPIKDGNPPDAEVDQPAPEVPKVGSRDAPGG
jgi:hypothetical protein